MASAKPALRVARAASAARCAGVTSALLKNATPCVSSGENSGSLRAWSSSFPPQAREHAEDGHLGAPGQGQRLGSSPAPGSAPQRQLHHSLLHPPQLPHGSLPWASSPAPAAGAGGGGGRAGAGAPVSPFPFSLPFLGGQPLRRLNIHEYQGAALMAKYGVNVPRNEVASTPQEAAKAAKELASYSPDAQVVLKAQVLAGGRGLGTFKNGFKGGVHIVAPDAIASIAEKMLGQILVTKQTGPEGKPVNKVLVAEKLQVVNEMYFAILLDRATAGPVIIACQKGGTSIEDLAEKYPDMIIKVPVKIAEGITEEQVQQVLDGLAPKVADPAQAGQQIKDLYSMFSSCDCTLLEINPLVETADKRMVAADAKINFDDNAAFRHKDIFALRDYSQEDPREVAASKADLNYIGLSGEIGCMVNGAGLAMATMDIIQLRGSSPANFLDVGGNASEGQVVEAFKILTSDASVTSILVNIFGGIMKCDVIASGIVNAAKQVSLGVPLVVRLEGTNVEIGKKILTESGLPIITAEDLDDAAVKAVNAAKGSA